MIATVGDLITALVSAGWDKRVDMTDGLDGVWRRPSGGNRPIELDLETGPSGVGATLRVPAPGSQVDEYEMFGDIPLIADWLTLNMGCADPALPVTESRAYQTGFAAATSAATNH